MTLLKKASEAIAGVAAGIEHLQTIAAAIRDGRHYLRLKHPELGTVISDICVELRDMSTAIAAASAILTRLRFMVGRGAVDIAPAFDDHLIAQKEKAQVVVIGLQAMRRHGQAIAEHVAVLRLRAKSLRLHRLLVLGIDSAERERDVTQSLLYVSQDETLARLAEQLSRALQLALTEIGNALGPPGARQPRHVAAAAVLLDEYGAAFGRLLSSSNAVALELQESIEMLERRA